MIPIVDVDIYSYKLAATYHAVKLYYGDNISEVLVLGNIDDSVWKGYS